MASYIRIRKEIMHEIEPFIKEGQLNNVELILINKCYEIYVAGLDKATKSALEIINKNFSTK